MSKKIMFALVLGLVLAGGANVAMAACDVDNPCGNGNPGQVSMPWGLLGDATPKIASGATIVDAHGVSDTCPAWYGLMGCYNITGTQYYTNQMLATARMLIANGTANQFPRFAGWIAVAR